jgi:hypothetical protein
MSRTSQIKLSGHNDNYPWHSPTKIKVTIFKNEQSQVLLALKQVLSGVWHQWEGVGYKERVEEGEYGGNIYSYMKMDKWNLLKLFQEWGRWGIKENEGGYEINYDIL